MTKKYPVNQKKPSKMFVNSLHGGGGSQANCHCGRVHYAPGNLRDSSDEDDYQNMLNSCLEEQRVDPEGVVIEYNDDFIHYKELNGILFVVDCPCNGLRRYEDFIWNNRDVFRDYLKIRVEREHEWAQQELVKNKLAGI